MAEATKLYHKKIDKEKKEMGMEEGEELRISEKYVNYELIKLQRLMNIGNEGNKIKMPTVQQAYDVIKKKMKKFSEKETIKLEHRNFILPSYHTKTYFRGATSLQLQTDASLQMKDEVLRKQFRLDRQPGD